jgi:CxxC motif-containing protein (DUF1111 family)
MIKNSTAWLLLALHALVCCKHNSPKDIPLPYNEAEKYAGGTSTTFDIGEQAFNHAVGGLGGIYKIKNYGSVSDTVTFAEYFKLGNSDFRMPWVSAGNTTTARDGLGPFLNATNCSACHSDDGRGKPDLQNGLLFRLSIPGNDPHGGPKPEPNYGGQLSNFAVFGVPAEGDVSILYEEIKGMFADGEAYSLRKPKYEFIGLNYGALSSEVLFSPRVGPQVYGLGLLEAIPESEILKYTDEYDTDKDSISGKANYVWDQAKQANSLGRFGWKANQPNLKQQIAGAFLGDMGLTSTLNPDENLSGNQVSLYGNLPTGGKPEVSDSIIEELLFYQRCLAVPGRRNIDKTEVIKGKQLFISLNCNKCHVEKQLTGTSTISALANQTIYPYTDLLLHDMGNGLADQRSDFLATGNEWRTPPLWGIGLIKTVNKHTFLLHDGRARDFKEAILWHGGEAEPSKNKFLKLSKTERDQLIQFLESM